MASAALLQIIAVGQEDQELTTNPQITFFKQVYKRHVPFAAQTVPLKFNNQFILGTTSSLHVDRVGDLLTTLTLHVKLKGFQNENTKWIDNLGNALIKTVDIEIGGNLVDRQYGEWIHIWNECSQPAAKKNVYKSMIGFSSSNAQDLYIPLNFWFCRYTTLALPLIALTHHHVKINITTRTWKELITTDLDTQASCDNSYITNQNIVEDAELLCDYIFLDNESRKEFAVQEHRFLIDQVQTTGIISIPATSKRHRYPLTFSHPVKAMYWYFQNSANASSKNNGNKTTTSFFDYSTKKNGNSVPIAKNMQLKVNGQEFTHNFGEKYFNMVQPYYRHTGGSSGVDGPIVGLYNYNFCLRPEEHQPTGSINFSRIENPLLEVEFTDENEYENCDTIDFKAFALSQNVFLISSGMGGVLFK